MTAKEFTEWMVYYSVEPFGGAREDFRASLQASVVANANGAKVAPHDFIKPWSFADEQRARVEAEAGGFSSDQKSQMTLLRALGGGNGNQK
jgi:hypothetical protein